MSIIHDPALHALRHALGGHVWDPGDPEYDEACALFNARIRRRPRLVVRCSRPRDVAAALEYARVRDLPVAVRAGGHSVAGLSLVDDGVVIDVRGLDEITVDPERRIARVGGGVTWAAVDAATEAHGLATVGGRVSSTGVAGLALGGGSGWLERKHGLTVDNMLAVELVTARGDLVRASTDQHPELFWALRGGGGNFGVVTAIELALHPLGPEVLAGLVLHPAERGGELMRRFRDVMDNAPDELSLAFAYLTGPDEDPIPAELRGRPAVAVVGMYAGPGADLHPRVGRRGRARSRGRDAARQARRPLRRPPAAAVGGRRRGRADDRLRPPLPRRARAVPHGRHLPQLPRRGGRGPRARGVRSQPRAPRAREGRLGPRQRLPRHGQRAAARLGIPPMCSRPAAASMPDTPSLPPDLPEPSP